MALTSPQPRFGSSSSKVLPKHLGGTCQEKGYLVVLRDGSVDVTRQLHFKRQVLCSVGSPGSACHVPRTRADCAAQEQTSAIQLFKLFAQEEEHSVKTMGNRTAYSPTALMEVKGHSCPEPFQLSGVPQRLDADAVDATHTSRTSDSGASLSAAPSRWACRSACSDNRSSPKCQLALLAGITDVELHTREENPVFCMFRGGLIHRHIRKSVVFGWITD